MIGVFGAIGFVAALFITMAVAMYVFLRKPGANNELSKYVLNHFEPDNTTPELTELIEYHKTSDRKIKYNSGLPGL